MKVPINQIPSREDYFSTIDDICKALSMLDGQKMASLIVYGSFAKDNFVPGKSDIDLCMILDCNVITNKSFLLSFGKEIKDIVRKRNVPLEIGVHDATTIKDKRFAAFNKTFENALKEGRILYGKNYLNNLNSYSFFHSSEEIIGFNLRWLRKKFVEAFYNIEKGDDTFAEDFRTFLTKLKNLKISLADYIPKNLSNKKLEKIIKITSDFKTFDSIRRNCEKAMLYWEIGLTGYEEVVKELINNYQGPEIRRY